MQLYKKMFTCLLIKIMLNFQFAKENKKEKKKIKYHLYQQTRKHCFFEVEILQNYFLGNVFKLKKEITPFRLKCKFRIVPSFN